MKRINQCNYLVRTPREVGRHFGRSAVALGRGGDEDMVEWNERKGHQMYEMADFYEKEAAKTSNELHNIIDCLDPIMYRWRRL